MIEIALYQPDIAANTGTVMRLAACLGLKVAVIEPAGFTWSDSSLKRAGLDYLDKAELIRDGSWDAFRQRTAGRRLVLMTTKAAMPYYDFRFATGDVIVMGRESVGVPDQVHQAAGARLLIPMRTGLRSINVALACAMATGEALRQLESFPR